jgi:protein-S-isoprenylcysteine O-methyltransferase Ste14
MPLQETLERQGHWLFRRRSYLPLILYALGIAGIVHTHQLAYENYLWEFTTLGVSLLGLVIRIITIGFVPPRTSGRNVKAQVADTLNTKGIYSICRHPLYLGNFFMWLGVAMFTRSYWASFLFIVIYWLYYERIMLAEEGFLREKFGQSFVEWASKTPAVFPAVWKWESSDRRFSLRKVLRQEHSGLMGTLVSFAILDTIQISLARKSLDFDPVWLYIVLGGLMTFIVIHILKKGTRLLKDPV